MSDGIPASKSGARIRRLDRAMPLDLERAYWARGLARVAGLDEAGRGPLAGPVVAAAVVMPAGRAVPGVYDSKALKAEERAEVFERVWMEAEAVGIGMATPEEIDLINIHQATLLAAGRALAEMGEAGPPPQILLTDFLKVAPPAGCLEVRAMAHGDQLCHAIAAASIVAKVVRDRLMHYYEWEYPGYGLARHKGYGTPEHLAALRERGATGIHRRTFQGVPLFGGSPVRSRFFGESSEAIRGMDHQDELGAMAALIEERQRLLPKDELSWLGRLISERLSILNPAV